MEPTSRQVTDPTPPPCVDLETTFESRAEAESPLLHTTVSESRAEAHPTSPSPEASGSQAGAQPCSPVGPTPNSQVGAHPSSPVRSTPEPRVGARPPSSVRSAPETQVGTRPSSLLPAPDVSAEWGQCVNGSLGFAPGSHVDRPIDLDAGESSSRVWSEPEQMLPGGTQFQYGPPPAAGAY